MNKRKQLNTDIAINTLISVSISNMLLLGLSKDKFPRAEFNLIMEQLEEMAKSTDRLSDKASQLDIEEGKV